MRFFADRLCCFTGDVPVLKALILFNCAFILDTMAGRSICRALFASSGFRDSNIKLSFAIEGTPRPGAFTVLGYDWDGTTRS